MAIRNKKDFFAGILLLVFSGVMYRSSYSISSGLDFALGPTFFPRILLICVALGAMFLILVNIGFQQAARPAAEPLDKKTFFYRFCLVALTLAYIMVIPVLGYATATLLFLMPSMLLMGERTLKNCTQYAIIAVAITFGLQYIFSDLLNLFLP
ncbi:MAG: tripartite tricarboxylate transporter TctB family protein [Desulfovibrio sp.]|jgi:hypothetical protein|nr:tripartite tricarboxylate transporter TctB family protein [Desulfovibrio sp.]